MPTLRESSVCEADLCANDLDSCVLRVFKFFATSRGTPLGVKRLAMAVRFYTYLEVGSSRVAQ
jgi:hypothetical protein